MGFISIKAYDEGYNNGYKAGQNELIEKACKWLNKHASNYAFSVYDEDDACSVSENLIDDFLKAMEE